MPILHLTPREGLELDLSISGAGPHTAATYIRDMLVQYPALRPIVIILKSLLVIFLSSMLHVKMEEAAGSSDTKDLGLMLIQFWTMEKAAGSDTMDLGLMLIQFCKRFGPDYDPYSGVVSVAAGGVVSRQLHCPVQSNRHPDRICVVEPNTGRDVTDGCYQSKAVLEAFARAHE
eukprot:gene27045-2279_t